jgi:hypothetical protein
LKHSAKPKEKSFYKNHPIQITDINNSDIENSHLKLAETEEEEDVFTDSSSSSALEPFVSYGIEFSKQFIWFISNSLSFIVAISFSNAVNNTLVSLIGQKKIQNPDLAWLPWVIAFLLLFISVILFALLSLWAKALLSITGTV